MVRLSGEQYLQPFVSDIERMVTEMLRNMLPRSVKVTGTRFELLEPVRNMFEIVGQDGSVWPWREAEVELCGAGPGSPALHRLVNSKVRVRPSLLARAQNVEPVLRAVFAADRAVANWIKQSHAAAELANIVLSRRGIPTELIPTGYLGVSGTRVHLHTIKITQVLDPEKTNPEGMSLD